jgi:hypothetical protein
MGIGRSVSGTSPVVRKAGIACALARCLHDPPRRHPTLIALHLRRKLVIADFDMARMALFRYILAPARSLKSHALREEAQLCRLLDHRSG